MVNQLIDILHQEASVFECFLDLLDRQKQALVANDVASLDRITRDQQDKLLQSQRLARRRERLIEDIRAANAIEGDLTVSRLLTFVDEQQAVQLRHLRDLMLTLTEQITRTRNSNTMLINQSREFIAKTMAMLAKIHHQEPAYARPSATETSAPAVMVDGRA